MKEIIVEFPIDSPLLYKPTADELTATAGRWRRDFHDAEYSHTPRDTGPIEIVGHEFSDANYYFDAIKQRFDRDNPFELTRENLLALVVTGSDSHGTKLEPTDPNAVDDLDLIGVVMPPVEYALGTRTWEGTSFWEGEIDFVAYSFQKFVRLLVKANPNVLGLLWLPERFVLKTSEAFDRLTIARDIFSTLEVYKSFAGYANGQLKRMTSFDLATSNRWDECVRVVEAMGWTLEQVTSKAHRAMPADAGARLDRLGVLGGNPSHGVAAAEIPWAQTKPELVMRQVNAYCDELVKLHARHFQGYMGAKRKALVVKHGYDCKNAGHLLRLLATCCDFLLDGKLRIWRGEFPNPDPNPRMQEMLPMIRGDAQYYIDLKQGWYDLPWVQREADRMFATAKRLAALNRAKLPESVDLAKVDALLVELQLDAYQRPEW